MKGSEAWKETVEGGTQTFHNSDKQRLQVTINKEARTRQAESRAQAMI